MNQTLATVKPPVPYFGSKARIASTIIAMLPAHKTYVEPFFGGGSLLLGKPKAPFEVVSDINGDLVNFWRVLRDHPSELERACALTPHSRQELADARASGEGLPDDLNGRVERARRVFVQLTQGRAASLWSKTGWRQYYTGCTSMGRVLSGYTDRIAAVAARLAEVSIDNRPAVDVIADYARDTSALIVCDPPYLADARHHTGKAARYAFEMWTEAEHQELATALNKVAGTAIVFGYPTAVYDRLYQGWWRYELPAWTTQGSSDTARLEVIWCNQPLTQQTLLDFTTPTVEPLRAGSTQER